MPRLNLAGAAGGLVVGLLAYGVHELGALSWADRFAYDAWVALAAEIGTRPTAIERDVIVVGIDEASHRRATAPGGPGLRGLVAGALDSLRPLAPGLVVVDVLMSDPGPAEADAALEASLRSYPPGRVLLASRINPGQQGRIAREELPLDRFRAAGALWGYVDVPEDPDGIVRRVQVAGYVAAPEPAAAGDPSERPALAAYLALAAARAYRSWPLPTWTGTAWEGARGSQDSRAAPAYRVPTSSGEAFSYMPYADLPGELPVIELAHLSRGPLDLQRIRGKLVLLGATFPRSTDLHRTPFSRTGRTGGPAGGVLVRDSARLGHRSYGVEVAASCTQAILDAGDGRARLPRDAAAPARALALGATGALLGLAPETTALGPWVLASGATAAVAAVAGSFLLFAHSRVHVPPAPFLAVLVLLGFLRVWLSSVRASARKELLQRTLARYVSPQICTAILADPDLMRLPGRRVEVTVLFCDLRDFTRLAEGLEPPAVLELMDTFLRAMAQAVVENGGVVNKFLGDGLMAFWGAPLPVPDHALLACRAARSMLDRLPEVGASLAARGLGPLAIGIGINSGAAVVGTVGDEERLEYTLVGDVVNVASRLQEMTKLYGRTLILGEGTVRELGTRLPVRTLGRVRVRGRVEPTEIAEPEDPRAPGAEAYAGALAAFQQGRFDEAAGGFRRALQEAPAYAPARILMDRSLELARRPPPGPWDGCYPG
jgi:adenylate cyclase